MFLLCLTVYKKVNYFKCNLKISSFLFSQTQYKYKLQVRLRRGNTMPSTFWSNWFHFKDNGEMRNCFVSNKENTSSTNTNKKYNYFRNFIDLLINWIYLINGLDLTLEYCVSLSRASAGQGQVTDSCKLRQPESVTE